MNQAVDFEQWEVVAKLLPEGWQQDAKNTGALLRARGIPDAEVLLRLILLHGVEGLSLKDTAAKAQLTGLCKLSSVALHDRLKRAAPWLRTLCLKLLAETLEDTQCLSGRWRWRVIDASEISEPGPTGSRWRLHYSLLLPSLECDFFELTSQAEGETLQRWHIREGDVVLIDRGYSHASGLAHVREAGGQFVVRWHPKSCPLFLPDGSPFDPQAWLAGYEPGEVAECALYFARGKRKYPVRLCAIAKGQQATERTRRQVKEKARHNQRSPSAKSLFLAGYTLVLTTLPLEEFTPEIILDIYRCRWQVELAFKRLKSLLALGHLPKHLAQTAEAWLLTKLLAALLVEKTLRLAQLFSPWGYRL
jgi:hypothetical protein